MGNSRIRLYGGLVRDGVWYNHAEVQDLEGGHIALMDSADSSGATAVRRLLQNSVPRLFAADGSTEYELQPADAGNFIVPDAFAIGREQMKRLTGEDYPKIREHHLCPRCSDIGKERYTETYDSWERLIEEGDILEYYVEPDDFEGDTPTFEFPFEFPRGFDIPEIRGTTITAGNYRHVTLRIPTVDDMITLANDPQVIGKNQALRAYRALDLAVASIDGISRKDLNILKKNRKESFSRNYLKHQEDIDALAENHYEIGLRGENRMVVCENCNYQMFGLDQTNFFSFFIKGKFNQSARQTA